MGNGLLSGGKEAGEWRLPPLIAQGTHWVGLYMYCPSVPSWRVIGRHFTLCHDTSYPEVFGGRGESTVPSGNAELTDYLKL